MCPRSPNDSRVPISCGPPGRPAARSGVRSRVWSVDAVVGSQPWSPVMNRTPPSERADQVGQPPVERLDRLRVAGRVVAMPVLRVEVHQVREDERRRRSPEVVEREIHAVVVRVRVPALRDALPGEDVADLADAVDRDAGRHEAVEHRRARRRHREVATLGRSDERPGGALERAGDHPADGVLAGEQPSRDAAPLVQRRQRHHVLVRRDLEHGVAARVHDGLAGADVLLAELRDDLGARRGDVAEDPAPDRLLERLRRSRAGTRPGTAGTARRAGSPSSPSARSSCPCRPSARWPGRVRMPVVGARRDPFDRREVPSPSDARFGACRPPTARDVLPSVSAPASPYAAASGASPTPHESQTTRSTLGTNAVAHRRHRFCLQSMQSSAHGRASRRSGSIGLPHRSHSAVRAVVDPLERALHVLEVRPEGLHDGDQPGALLRAVRAVGEARVVDERHLVAIRVGALFLDLVAHLRALRDQRLAHALDEPLVRHPTHPFLVALRRARGCDV